MKKTKEEMIATVNALEVDDTVKIGLLEDVADSFEEAAPVDMSGYVSKEEYDELKRKYIERFTSSTPEPAPAVEEPEEEKKRISIEDLFVEKED